MSLHRTHTTLHTYDWHYVVIISGPPRVDSLIYSHSMAGTQTCFCSLCCQKFLLWPSAALALKERLLVCLQSQNPTVKSGVVRGSCTHASKTKQMFAFPLQTPFGMRGVLLARKNRGLVGVHEGPQVIFTSTVDAGIVAEAWYLCTGTGSAVLSGCLPTQLQQALRIAKQGWTYNRRYWL